MFDIWDGYTSHGVLRKNMEFPKKNSFILIEILFSRSKLFCFE